MGGRHARRSPTDPEVRRKTRRGRKPAAPNSAGACDDASATGRASARNAFRQSWAGSGMDLFAEPCRRQAVEDADSIHRRPGRIVRQYRGGPGASWAASAALVTARVGRRGGAVLRQQAADTTASIPNMLRAVTAVRSRTSLALYESRLAGHFQNGDLPQRRRRFSRSPLADVDRRGFDGHYRRVGHRRHRLCRGTVSRSAAFRAFELRPAPPGVPIIFDVDYRPYTWPSARRSPPTSCRAPGAASRT